jgi:hypothetical protein
MKSQSLVAGVDVSKDTLDIYFNDEGGKGFYLKAKNERRVISLFWKSWASKEPMLWKPRALITCVLLFY